MKKYGSLGESSCNCKKYGVYRWQRCWKRGSFEPYIRVTSRMGLPPGGRSHSGVHKLGCSCTQCQTSVTLICTLHINKTITLSFLVTHIAQNINIWAIQRWFATVKVKERKSLGCKLKLIQSNFLNRSSRSILMSHGLPKNQLSWALLTNS